MLVGGVLDTAIVQIVVEARLIDRVHGTETHRHRRELPELGHESRVRVGGQTAALTGVTVLLPEPVHPLGGDPALEEGTGVDTRRRVTLDEDLVAAAWVFVPAEEVVEADLVQRRRRRVGRDVTADPDPGTLSAVHHDGGVPADELTEGALDALVAGEPGFEFGGNGVDVIGGRQRGDGDVLLACALEQPEHQIAGSGRSGMCDEVVEALQPLAGLVGVDVGQVGRDTLTDDAHARTDLSGVPPEVALTSFSACSVTVMPTPRSGRAGVLPGMR